MSSDTETNPLSWSETITLIDATALTQAKFDVSMESSITISNRKWPMSWLLFL
jgi:hypothetical protein